MKVGGLEALMVKYFEAVPKQYGLFNSNITNASEAANLSYSISSCGLPRKDAFHILRDPLTSDLPWPGVLIRSTFVSMWYWCADQVVPIPCNDSNTSKNILRTSHYKYFYVTRLLCSEHWPRRTLVTHEQPL